MGAGKRLLIGVFAFLALTTAVTPAATALPVPAAPAPAARPHIVGGVDATETYPFAAVLENGNNLVCTGTLIAPQWVQTAGHCVAGNTDWQIRLGSNDRTSGGDFVTYTTIAVGPGDMALIQLANPVSEAPAPIASAAPPPGTPVRQLGWGVTSDPLAAGDPPAMLQQLDTTIADPKTCNGLEDNQICVNNVGGSAGVCYGDSGGPLLIKVDGGWQLIGSVIGAGYQGKCGKGPSVYQNVAAFKSWINGMTGGKA